MYFVAYILAASPDALALSRVVQFSELRSGAGEFCLLPLCYPLYSESQLAFTRLNVYFLVG